jgi:hypothetical protein
VARSLRVLVPESRLPGSDYGSGARRLSPTAAKAAALSPQDAAVTAAAAVFDVLMPRLPADVSRGEPADAVMQAASNVGRSLANAGMGPDEAERVVRRVAAEAARWLPGGIVLRRKWTLR